MEVKNATLDSHSESKQINKETSNCSYTKQHKEDSTEKINNTKEIPLDPKRKKLMWIRKAVNRKKPTSTKQTQQNSQKKELITETINLPSLDNLDSLDSTSSMHKKKKKSLFEKFRKKDQKTKLMIKENS